MENKQAIEQLVTSIATLVACKDIPDDPRRELSDAGVQRLMSSELKTLVQNIQAGVEVTGYELDSRILVERLCKSVGVMISWKPLERDSFGWLTAKLVTDKGYVLFG